MVNLIKPLFFYITLVLRDLQPPNYLIGISSQLKLCLANAIHSFNWVKIIQILKMEVNDF